MKWINIKDKLPEVDVVEELKRVFSKIPFTSIIGVTTDIIIAFFLQLQVIEKTHKSSPSFVKEGMELFLKEIRESFELISELENDEIAEGLKALQKDNPTHGDEIDELISKIKG